MSYRKPIKKRLISFLWNWTLGNLISDNFFTSTYRTSSWWKAEASQAKEVDVKIRSRSDFVFFRVRFKAGNQAIVPDNNFPVCFRFLWKETSFFSFLYCLLRYFFITFDFKFLLKSFFSCFYEPSRRWFQSSTRLWLAAVQNWIRARGV